LSAIAGEISQSDLSVGSGARKILINQFYAREFPKIFNCGGFFPDNLSKRRQSAYIKVNGFPSAIIAYV
jgi:hypothetical protein